MSDARTTRCNGRVAHTSLRGEVEATRFVEAEAHPVSAVVADLRKAPGGPRERQLLRGELFMLLDFADGYAFGYAARDGYCGWVEAAVLGRASEGAPTHRVAVARSYAKTTPGLKTMGQVTPLPLGARLNVLDEADSWMRVAWSRGTAPRDMFVPSRHLTPVDAPEADPVAVAQQFIGTPYLWGGNSAFGIDCSGLVQAACLACGVPCPGDSDQQQATLGTALPEGAALRRGDLVFWTGHVGILTDADTLLHANAHHMAVAQEPLQSAIARIAGTECGGTATFKRLESSP